MSSNPVPAEVTRVRRSKTEARDWYDRLSRCYDVLVEPFERPARNAGIDLLNVTAGEAVLDVGCGTGVSLVAFARQVAPDGTAVGIDLSSGMCQRARRSLEEAGLACGVVVEGDAAALPFREDVFDAVFAGFVLELFDTPEIPTVLEELARVLAPGGRLCVVALSRRTNGPGVWLYERIHDRFPTYVDCRPIYAWEALREAGYRPVDRRYGRLWGLPVDVVLARVTESGSREPAP